MTKNQTDAERFSRYQSVVDVLLRKGSFHKTDIYDALKDEDQIRSRLFAGTGEMTGPDQEAPYPKPVDGKRRRGLSPHLYP
jgi:hypothetical protein